MSATTSRLPGQPYDARRYDYGEARRIADDLQLADPVAIALVRRGHRTVEAARAFLDAEETHDPGLFEGIEDALESIAAAIAAGKRITVHGDYDVDGICSTSIMVAALRRAGADCDWLIPDRLGDGYGLSAGSLDHLRERRDRVAGHGRLRDRLRGRDRGDPRGRDRRDRHRPSPARRAAPRLPDRSSGGQPLPVREPLRRGGGRQARRGDGARDRRRRVGRDPRPRPRRARDGRRPGPADRREPVPGPARARADSPRTPSRPAGADGDLAGGAGADRRGRHRLPARTAVERRRAPLPCRRRASS